MSNRTDLSDLRNLLHRACLDLRGVELKIIGIEPAGGVGRARDALSAAIDHLTDALKHDVDLTAEQASGVRL